MNIISKISKIVPLLLLVVVFQSCSSDDDNTTTPPPTPNIVELASDTADLSSLVAALQAADGDLVNVLNGSGPFTVLAPTNAAFDAFLSANGFATLADVPTDVLANILLNHVITGNVSSTDLTTQGAGYANTNATNADGDNLSLYFNTTSGVQFNGVSTVSTADVTASNGTVHIVNAVIGLPTVVDFAVADPTFDILQAALTRSDLTFDYVTTLSGSGPFTVFAPTNDAFVALLAELEVDELGDIDEPTLKATLDHHAVAGANVRAEDLMDMMTVSTLGGDITANITGGATLTDANDRVSNIVATNVQAMNGVIHAIDKVVLPPL